MTEQSMNGDAAQERTGRRKRPLLLGALALLPFAFLAARAWHSGPATDAGDHAQYLLHAKALLQGRPYVETGYLYTPHRVIGPQAYPPGLPLTLSVAGLAFELNENVAAVVTTLFAVAFLILAARTLAPNGPMPAWIIILAVGVVPAVSDAGTRAVSDVPFAAMCWATIALADGSRDWNFRRIAGLVLCGSLALLYRTAGIALIPAMAAFGVLHWRTLRLRPIVIATAWMAVLIASELVVPMFSTYSDDVAMSELSTARRMLANLVAYRVPFAEATLSPFPWSFGNDVYHLIALLLAAIGLARLLPSKWNSMLYLFAAAYLPLLLYYRVASIRYLLPILPLILFGFVYGLFTLLAWLRRDGRRAMAWAVGATAVLAVTSFLRTAAAPRPVGLTRRAEVRALFAHVRAQHRGEPNVRYMFFNPRVLTLYTGVPAMALFEAPSDVLWSELRRHRVTHLALGSPRDAFDTARAVPDLIAHSPERFALEYVDRMFRVYRLRQALPARGHDAEAMPESAAAVSSPGPSRQIRTQLR
ncbi:MAG: hypothetical protein ACT4R6_01530 [Gemmatimonadaceae bacterium]